MCHRASVVDILNVLLDGVYLFFFFFNDTATTEIYTLSLHDALPIYGGWTAAWPHWSSPTLEATGGNDSSSPQRSEEHTSELQSRFDLVCRLLLEKKNINTNRL